MKNFIVLIVVVTMILIAVSKLLDPLMGIFIVCIVVSLLLNVLEDERRHKKPND